MKMKILLLFMTIALSSDLHLVNCSQILVENGVYSRVTVQIEPQPQPADCVDFLDKLEVGKHLYSDFPFLNNTYQTIREVRNTFILNNSLNIRVVTIFVYTLSKKCSFKLDLYCNIRNNT